VRSHVDEGWKYAAGLAVKELRAALSLPRRTEADIRTDERERLAKKLEAEDQGWLSRSATVQETVKWLRSQGGEDE